MSIVKRIYEKNQLEDLFVFNFSRIAWNWQSMPELVGEADCIAVMCSEISVLFYYLQKTGIF